MVTLCPEMGRRRCGFGTEVTPKGLWRCPKGSAWIINPSAPPSGWEVPHVPWLSHRLRTDLELKSSAVTAGEGQGGGQLLPAQEERHGETRRGREGQRRQGASPGGRSGLGGAELGTVGSGITEGVFSAGQQRGVVEQGVSQPPARPALPQPASDRRRLRALHQLDAWKETAGWGGGPQAGMGLVGRQRGTHLPPRPPLGAAGCPVAGAAGGAAGRRLASAGATGSPPFSGSGSTRGNLGDTARRKEGSGASTARQHVPSTSLGTRTRSHPGSLWLRVMGEPPLRSLGVGEGSPWCRTWVEGLHAAVEQADVQLAEVHGVVERGDEHPPDPRQDPHQDVDGEEQEGDDVESSPAGGGGGK